MRTAIHPKFYVSSLVVALWSLTILGSRTAYIRILYLEDSKVRSFVLHWCDFVADQKVPGNESCGIVAPPNVISTSYGQGHSFFLFVHAYSS